LWLWRLHLITDIESAFTNNELDYGRKLYLIENCIYGVDIQPIAVQIAKLRFFISLVVDQKKQVNEENLGIRALPNLETKFVAANTLIGLENEKDDWLNNQEIIQLKNELKDIRHQYFSAKTRKEKLLFQKKDKDLRRKIKSILIEIQKRELTAKINNSKEMLEIGHYDEIIKRFNDNQKKRKEFETKRHKLSEKLEKIKKSFTSSSEKTAKQLSSWDPYDQNLSSPFFEPEWMFGITNGFDVVIANPPYEEISNKEEKMLFQRIYSEVLSSHYDLYIFFFKKAFDIVRRKGIVTFITPHTYLHYTQFKNLRKWLYEQSHILEITSRISNIFESAVVDNAIIFIQAYAVNDNNLSKFTRKKIKNNKLIDEEKLFLRRCEFSSDNFNLETIKNRKIFKKFLKNSELLGEVTKSSQGITVYAKVQGEKKNWFRRDKNDNNSKPIIRGREIQRYFLKWSGDYIQYGNWLWCPRNPKFFENEKLFFRQTADTLIGTYIREPVYCIDSVHSIISLPNVKNYSLKYILAILNSRMGNFLYKLLIPETGKVFAQVKLIFLRQIPIKKISILEQKPFIDLADKILTIAQSGDYLENLEKQTQVKKYKNQIDQIVYKLYDLTDDEIEIVENFHKKL